MMLEYTNTFPKGHYLEIIKSPVNNAEQTVDPNSLEKIGSEIASELIHGYPVFITFNSVPALIAYGEEASTELSIAKGRNPYERPLSVLSPSWTDFSDYADLARMQHNFAMGMTDTSEIEQRFGYGYPRWIARDKLLQYLESLKGKVFTRIPIDIHANWKNESIPTHLVHYEESTNLHTAQIFCFTGASGVLADSIFRNLPHPRSLAITSANISGKPQVPRVVTEEMIELQMRIGFRKAVIVNPKNDSLGGSWPIVDMTGARIELARHGCHSNIPGFFGTRILIRKDAPGYDDATNFIRIEEEID